MGRVKIDTESWARHKEFTFFVNMLDPIITFTSEINVDNCYTAAKQRGDSFFIYYSYAIIKTLNEIEAFRLRVVREPHSSEPEVYLYDVVDITTPIKISEDGRYIEMSIPYTPSFEEFYSKAKEVIESAPVVAQSNAEIFFTMNEEHTYACISAMPDLHFTGVKHACTQQGGVNMLSLISVGKMITRDGCQVVPIALSAHHGLVDGCQISSFFARVQKILDTL